MSSKSQIKGKKTGKNPDKKRKEKEEREITTGPWTGSEAMKVSTSDSDQDGNGLSRFVNLV